MNSDELNQLFGSDNGSELMKAISAGDLTGLQTVNQNLPGIENIKIQSLDATMRLLESDERQIKLLNMLPKQSIASNIHEYMQLVKYGTENGLFMGEGEVPEYSDTSYKRKSILAKYMGRSGQVTLQATLARRADGKDPLAAEVESKTALLRRSISRNLTNANSACNSLEFDGIWKQHFDGINEIYTGGNTLDNYFNDPCVIDARGKALDDNLVQEAVQAVVTQRYGMVTTLLAPPVVYKDYVKRYQDQKRFIIGAPGAISGATTGQSVTNIQTQLGSVKLESDIFMDERLPKAYNAPATGGSKSPSSITVGTTPVASKTDTKTRFKDSAGSYCYAVSARNSSGESAMVRLNSVAQAVSTTQSVELSFTITDNSYPATSFVIYRTEKDASADSQYYPIFEVTASELANGYDGAGAGKIWDRNRMIANTHSAMAFEPSSNLWEYLQFGSTMKIDLAMTSLSHRFSVVNFGTPVIYMPGKVCRIINIGSVIV